MPKHRWWNISIGSSKQKPPFRFVYRYESQIHTQSGNRKTILGVLFQSTDKTYLRTFFKLCQLSILLNQVKIQPFYRNRLLSLHFRSFFIARIGSGCQNWKQQNHPKSNRLKADSMNKHEDTIIRKNKNDWSTLAIRTKSAEHFLPTQKRPFTPVLLTCRQKHR